MREGRGGLVVLAHGLTSRESWFHHKRTRVSNFLIACAKSKILTDKPCCKGNLHNAFESFDSMTTTGQALSHSEKSVFSSVTSLVWDDDDEDMGCIIEYILPSDYYQGYLRM